jgi:hypothetical protein
MLEGMASALPALQTFNTFSNLKMRGLHLSPPLNVRFDVLSSWRVAGLERCASETQCYLNFNII